MADDALRIKKILVKNMKKYRAKLELTQEAAAEKAGMTLKYWQRLEMVSQTDLPSLQMISKIAESLEVPIWKMLQ